MAGLPVRTRSIRTSLWRGVALVAAALALGAAGFVAEAALDTPRALWPEDLGLSWQVMNHGGIPVRDPENGGSNDLSNGGASFTAEGDLASDWNDAGGYIPPQGTCNPYDPASGNCGSAATMLWAYWDGGSTWDGVNGSATMTDDVLYFRMRINGDPREPSGASYKLNNNHWNFLHDYDADGYKEFWFDVFGNEDIVRLLYENIDDQEISNEVARIYGTPCQDPLGVLIDTLLSCASTTTGTISIGKVDYSCAAYSHTRAVQITGSRGAPNASSTEWYVDLQVPMALTKIQNDGCEPGYDPLDYGSHIYLIEPISPRQFVYSTSDSSTDPLQKDYTPGCYDEASSTMQLCYPDATPITLAYFRATRQGSRLHAEWITSSEIGNTGFELYAKTATGWEKLHDGLIPSTVGTSLDPTRYELTTRWVDAEEFAVVDVDVEGNRRTHDGLVPEADNGTRPAADPIDWNAVGGENRGKSQARQAERRAGASAQAAAAKAGAAEWPVFELHVTQDGVYRVTYEALAAAGLDLAGVSTGTIGVTNRGAAVPVYVFGSGARGKQFGPGSYVEFVGEGLDTIYTRTNVYRLVIDSKSASRVREERAAPARRAALTTAYTETVRVENERVWSASSPTDDPWYDLRMVAGTSPVSFDLGVAVDDVVPEGAAKVLVGLWGETNWPGEVADHHVRVGFNGGLVGEAYFDGLTGRELALDLPNGLLHDGANTVTVSVAGDTGFTADVVNLDSYGVSYQRRLAARSGRLAFTAQGDAFKVSGLPTADVVVYRVSAAGTVTRLTGFTVVRDGATFAASFAGSRLAAEYQVASAGAVLTPAIVPPAVVGDLTTGPAQYLVVAHPDFIGDVGPLVAAREAQGLSVKVVDTDSIQATFGHGIFGPEGLRDYIAWAIAHLGTEYVLLVGGDTYDYMNRTGLGSFSFVPTFYTLTEPLARYTPSDGLLADADGDLLPDVAIGRFPVRTSTQLAELIGKTLAYSGAGRQAVFAADAKDGTVSFAVLSDKAIAQMPGGWSVQRTYLDDLGVAGARTDLIGAMNAGAALTHYLGHSDSRTWSYHNLFGMADAQALTNAGRPTVVVQWGCWNTYFVTVSASSLAEKLLVSGDRGAAAVIGPSGRTRVESDSLMSTRLMPLLVEPGTSVGQALLAAKRATRDANAHAIDVYLGVNLLGDPALVIEP